MQLFGALRDGVDWFDPPFAGHVSLSPASDRASYQPERPQLFPSRCIRPATLSDLYEEL